MESLIGYLEAKYGRQATKWRNEVGKKRYFSDLYHNMIEGLRTLGPVENTYIKVAIHNAVAQDEITLQRIIAMYR